MARYLVDRMIVADSRFDKLLDKITAGSLDIAIVEEILAESRGDGRYEAIKRHSSDVITKEHIDILKDRVVDKMIDCGALLPDEGTGETMIAAEYWYEGIGVQTNIFKNDNSSIKIIVTDDKKATKFFSTNSAHVIDGAEFFAIVNKVDP